MACCCRKPQKPNHKALDPVDGKRASSTTQATGREAAADGMVLQVAAEAQLCLDLLTHSSPPYETDLVPHNSITSSYTSPHDGPPDLDDFHQSIPIYASNMDFVYSGKHYHPRLAQVTPLSLIPTTACVYLFF